MDIANFVALATTVIARAATSVARATNIVGIANTIVPILHSYYLYLHSTIIVIVTTTVIMAAKSKRPRKGKVTLVFPNHYQYNYCRISSYKIYMFIIKEWAIQITVQ